MDGFEVDLDALGAARDQVGRLAAEMPEQPRDIPDATAFGHDKLAKAVTAFADREKSGLANLTADAESIHRDLAETIRTYRDVDEEAARRFGGITR